MELSVEIRLSMQRALIQNLSNHVRGICCDWDDDMNWFKIRYYLDIEPNAEEYELQSIALTEFHCDLDFKKFHEECVFADEPFEKLDKLRMVLLWRNEVPVFN